MLDAAGLEDEEPPATCPAPARQASAAVEGRPRIIGRDLLFGRGRNGFQGWSQSKARLDTRLGFNKDWNLHDLRRSVETRMSGLRIPKDHVNKVLNHAAGPITEAYDLYDYLPEKAAVLQRWADELERITSQPAIENWRASDGNIILDIAKGGVQPK